MYKTLSINRADNIDFPPSVCLSIFSLSVCLSVLFLSPIALERSFYQYCVSTQN